MRKILAILTGLIIGSLINMGVIMCGGYLISLPVGVDNTTTEGLQATIHLFEPKHFIFPFMAHALGTLVGAFVVSKISNNQHFIPSLIIGIFFFIGGSMMVYQLPTPMWFNVIDLIFAYLPMAYIGYKLATKQKGGN